MDEAIASPSAQQAKAALPAGTVDQQSNDAFAKASYQQTISAYGQAQNAMAYLRSTVQGMGKSVETGTGGPGGQQKNAKSDLGSAVRAVQSFVNAYNANGPAGAQNAQALLGIGIKTAANGTLSLDAQTFRKALSSNPQNTVKVFSSLVESLQAPTASNGQPASQYSVVSSLG
jgi:flagellar capping protein FliD